MRFRINFSSGQSLVEIILAIGLLALLLPALMLGVISSREGKAQQKERGIAIERTKEVTEALRSIREKDWNAFAVNGTFHPIRSGTSWQLVPGASTSSGLTTSIVISNVNRNENGVIVSSGGTPDPSTKQAQVIVSWTAPIAASVSETLYLTRFKNSSYVETTLTDFNGGVNTGTANTNTSGGEVILGAGGSADWCNPLPSIVAQFNLPKSGTANAVSAYQGRAIAGTGENSSGVSLADVTITNTDPPVPSLEGSFNGYKTNDVFIDAGYAYLATDNNGKEVVIVNLANHLETGYFNIPGNPDATSVYVLGNRGYVTAGNYLYVFDLASKSGSRPQVGDEFFFFGSATSVVVNGSYAYVSLASSPIEMQIINISNPQSWSNTGWVDVNGTDGKRIFVNQTGTRAYLATNSDPSKREFFIIDISQKTGSRPLIGSYEANGMSPANLSVVPGNKALLVGSNAEEYQVIDLTNEANPVRCGGMNVNTGIRGVVGVLESDGDAYSYIVTGDASSEFKIIEGGPGGQFATTGDFVSKVFDAGYSTAFNRITFTYNQPVNTAMRFQVAVADPVNNSCSSVSYVYVGPDGTSGTYFTVGGTIPVNDNGSGYENPGRCFRYKGYFTTTDPSTSPTFYDATINYSL